MSETSSGLDKDKILAKAEYQVINGKETLATHGFGKILKTILLPSKKKRMTKNIFDGNWDNYDGYEAEIR